MTDGASGYRLLDCGAGRKLERFGEMTIVRPAAAARGRPALPPSRWSAAAAVFEPGASWQVRSPPPDPWLVRVGARAYLLKLAPSGQVGFFPEQEPLRERIGELLTGGRARAAPGAPHAGTPLVAPPPGAAPDVLNLFAYTGGSTLAAAAAGASVTHVDPAKSALGWARANLEHNGLAHAPVRWLPEDATRFVARALRRGTTYAAIILDPPSFGRGPGGRTWSLEKNLDELLADCRRVLSPVPLFVLVTAHTEGWEAPALAARLDRACEGLPGDTTSGDLTLVAEAGPVLRAGIFALRVFRG